MDNEQKFQALHARASALGMAGQEATLHYFLGGLKFHLSKGKRLALRRGIAARDVVDSLESAVEFAESEARSYNQNPHERHRTSSR